MERTSGVLMHISSLNGDYSIGSFGEEAKEFVDYLSDAGFTWWQVLPFCPVDECNSPYKSQGAFGGNPFFVDLKKLCDKGLLTENELESAEQIQPYSAEFEKLNEERLSLLKLASSRVIDKEKIEEFVDKNPYISKFCEFMALKGANDNKAWIDWTEEKTNSEVLFMWKFIQYEFFSQWAEIKEYANSKGIKILGDIPIYVSHDSADVWANKELFLLNKDGTPTCVAGVPPDYFCEDGQLWGNPIYDYKRMKQDGYSWWKDRISHMLSMFDGVRIDHFRGIEAYWSIPYDAESAREGKWVKGPGIELIDAIKSVSKDKLIVAEDLGLITEDVVNLVKESGFPGMKVLQFGFLGEQNSPHMPHNYNENCIAYTGTHDNNTLLGYVWELSEEQRNTLLEYVGYTDKNWDNCYDSVLRAVYQSHAETVIFPIQDLLGYGSDTRLNVPGRPEKNWEFRVTKGQLKEINWNKFKRWNNLYGRRV